LAQRAVSRPPEKKKNFLSWTSEDLKGGTPPPRTQLCNLLNMGYM